MTAAELNNKIIWALKRPDIIRSRDICIADVAKNPGVSEEFSDIVRLLSGLQGRTVKRVEWVNIPDRNINVLEETGHFEIHLEP